MDAFRSIPEAVLMSKKEARITTNNQGFLRKPNYTAINHGLNKFYYSIPIAFKKNEYEQNMLHCLYKSSWTNSLKQVSYTEQHEKNLASMKRLATLTEKYNKWIQEETKKTTEEFKVESVGKMNPHAGLYKETEETLNRNVVNSLGTMLSTVVF
jgi:26S proteasome regulatory subunit N11